MIRVVLIQPHSLYARALSLLIQQQQDMALVGTAKDVMSAMALMDETGLADVAIVDRFISGDSPDGVEVGSLLRKHFPTMEIMLTAQYFYPRTRMRAKQAGVKGLIVKHKAASILPDAIRTVFEEGEYHSELPQTPPISSSPYGLTANEIKVLVGLANGQELTDIAFNMSRREASIRSYQRNLMAKLDAYSPQALHAQAQKLGYL